MKQLLTLLFFFYLGTNSMRAQVTYHDISPDTTVDEWAPYVIEYGSSELYIWYHPFEPNQVVVNCFGIEVLFDGRYPAKLNSGDPISSSGTWKEPAYDTMNIGGTYGHWIGATDKYLAFRFRLNGQMHYAWLRMDVDATPTYFTVKDLAYNATSDAGLTAGQGISSVKEAGKQSPLLIIANKRITLRQPGGGSYTASIYSLTGQELIKMPFAGNTIDLSNLPGGMYLLRLEDGINQYGYKITLP